MRVHLGLAFCLHPAQWRRGANKAKDETLGTQMVALLAGPSEGALLTLAVTVSESSPGERSYGVAITPKSSS